MSYVPILVISKADMDKYEELLIRGAWQYDNSDEYTRGGEDGTTVLEYLRDVYVNHRVMSIKGVEFYMCSPSYSSYNKSIRDKLEELGIEYTVEY